MVDDLLHQLGATVGSIAGKTKELVGKGAAEIAKRTGKEASSCDLSYALEIKMAQDITKALEGNDFNKAKLLLSEAEKVDMVRKALGCGGR